MHHTRLHFCAPRKISHIQLLRVGEPCAIEMAKTVLGTKAEKKLSLVPLSYDVIHSRICDISKDVLQQMIANTKASQSK